MRKFFLAVCFLLHGSVFCSSDCSIVFVHIGNTLPSYIDIDVAIDQARLFNKDIDIYLIANESALKGYNKDGVRIITCESLKKSKQHEVFLKESNFAQGFWRYTIERFYYIDELVSKYDLSNVIHLEYDNLLYVDLKEILPVFTKNYLGMGAILSHDSRAVPGLVYFSGKKSTKHFTCFLSGCCEKKLNDAKSIALYKDLYPKEVIDFLPILTKEYADSHSLKTKTGITTKDKSRYYSNIDVFNSIFDGQAIGVYFGGQDPRNGKSFPGQINILHTFNPAELEYEWFLDDQGRCVPYMIYDECRYRINNLHIHCKDPEKFTSWAKRPGKVEITVKRRSGLHVR